MATMRNGAASAAATGRAGAPSGSSAARDLDGFLHRSWIKAKGVTDETFRGRPVIGICTAGASSSTATSTRADWPSR